MVSLSSDGHLLCSYMGTDPSFFSTPKVDAREADYAQVEAEMKKLQKFIREATRTQGKVCSIQCLSNTLDPGPGYLFFDSLVCSLVKRISLYL